MRRKRFVFLLLLLALLLTACGVKKGGLRVEGAWGRPSPKMAMAGAFYMTIYNDGAQDDRLISAASPACGTVELHESYMTPEGAMGMRPVAGGIPVPAKGKAELKVGGLHIMCIDVKEGFEVGKKVPLTLHFEKGGDLSVEVEIRQEAP